MANETQAARKLAAALGDEMGRLYEPQRTLADATRVALKMQNRAAEMCHAALAEAHARGRREAAAIAEIYREALLGKRTGECPCCGVKDGGHDPICELVPAEEYMEALTANTEVSDGS